MAPMVVQGQGVGRQQRRRVWRSRLAHGARHEDGKVAWQAYSTGPDKDVLIGPTFKPFYAQRQGQDLGVKTWPPDAWRIGGGTVWGWISYDPAAEPHLLRHRESRARGIPEDAARRQQVDLRASSRATPTPARRSGSTRCRPTISTTGTASTRTSCSICPSGQHAQGAGAARSQRLHVRDRPHDGRGALGRHRMCYITTTTGVDLKTGALQYVIRRRRRRLGRSMRDICPDGSRRQRLAALLVLATDRAALHPARESVHG